MSDFTQKKLKDIGFSIKFSGHNSYDTASCDFSLLDLKIMFLIHHKKKLVKSKTNFISLTF